MTSELASHIRDALNGNEHWPSRVDIPHDQDVQVGPLTFRYGGGPHRDRWYLVETPHVCADDKGVIQHDFQPDPATEGLSRCVREGCGYGGILTLNIRSNR